MAPGHSLSFSLFAWVALFGLPAPWAWIQSAAVPSPTQRPHWPSVHLSAPASHGRNQQTRGTRRRSLFFCASFLRWLVSSNFLSSFIVVESTIETHSLKHLHQQHTLSFSQANILSHIELHSAALSDFRSAATSPIKVPDSDDLYGQFTVARTPLRARLTRTQADENTKERHNLLPNLTHIRLSFFATTDRIVEPVEVVD